MTPTAAKWQDRPRIISRQVNNGIPLATGVYLSVSDFKALFPFYTTSTTTICSPEIHNWIAEMKDGSALWIGVGDDEVNPNDWATT